MIGINEARNGYQAMVQAMFYLVGLIGNIRIGVNYRDQNGDIQTAFEDVVGPAYILSSAGGWSDPQYVYAQFDTPPGWSPVAQVDDSASTLVREDKRVPVPINDLASEVQWWLETESGYNDYMLRVVSYEGENLGVKPDLR